MQINNVFNIMKIFILILCLLAVSCGQKKDTNTAKDDKSTTGIGSEKKDADNKSKEKTEIGKDEIFLCRNIKILYMLRKKLMQVLMQIANAKVY